ncbi:TlyA family RNA methyltransferase [Burkholderiaceae bacterium FT117]|uniref:TlyA family RNA methyltransferase n=1 Tax=Zeimonas sediminis TaxID=2944268 RepID=UPI002342E0C4|nr:TlyA family RNA methyltransferase [Zeimonas sediminis]MCM5571649.1 TlyA family RNA methyltransferase [Zeimonas sediminis]
MRADQLLVARGLAASRTRARELIEAGAVRLRTAAGLEPLRKPSAALADDAELLVDDAARPRFVSRGGLKLEGALAAAGVDPRGMACLDLGQSTGGFTDCLLQAGAARVVGIDVGHGQLHPSLRDDPRVVALEGVNVRALAGADAPAAFAAARPPGGFDLAVADLSFISLAHALAPAAALLRPGGTLLALVKPQFEVGPGGVDSRGIVRDERRYAEVRARIEAAAREAGLSPRSWHDSPIRGGDGNREFFLHAVK